VEPQALSKGGLGQYVYWTRLLFFNRIQSRVTSLLTGYNTLRSHLYIRGVIDSLLCKRCGAEEETSAHASCVCQALVTDITIWVPFSWTLMMFKV